MVFTSNIESMTIWVVAGSSESGAAEPPQAESNKAADSAAPIISRGLEKDERMDFLQGLRNAGSRVGEQGQSSTA
ncbi:MAG: hypothetical protein LBS56_10175, partial [Propionibacteriaceae bacterium]|nr:hypothetical protein [Propionibacteriaceae bacterium]